MSSSSGESSPESHHRRGHGVKKEKDQDGRSVARARPVRSYPDDVFKSLDDVVKERGIEKPIQIQHSSGPKRHSSQLDDGPDNGRRPLVSREMCSGSGCGSGPESTFSTRTQYSSGSKRHSSQLDNGLENCGLRPPPSFPKGVGSGNGYAFGPGFTFTMQTQYSSGLKRDSSQLDDDGPENGGMRPPPSFSRGVGSSSRTRVGSSGNGYAPGPGSTFTVPKELKPLQKVFTSTPYRAVHDLNELGMIITLKIGKLVDEDMDIEHLWRCEVVCGLISGTAECKRKVIAKEVACKAFLENLQKAYPKGQIPKYEIPEELFLNPDIIKIIDRVAARKGMHTEDSVAMWLSDKGLGNGDADKQLMFKCIRKIDFTTTEAESYDPEFARLLAAGKAYELISNKTFPKTQYFVGEDCRDDYEYNFIETEFNINLEEVKEEKDADKGAKTEERKNDKEVDIYEDIIEKH